MFLRNKGTYSWLIAGLGNPEPKYEQTRHNAGFLAIDRLAEKRGASIKKMKFHALTGEAEISGERCLLLKPLTFMNLSGEAVEEASQFYKIYAVRTFFKKDAGENITEKVERIVLKKE